MSTECVPLSMSTPPPEIAGSEFQRRVMSTREANRFSTTMSSPRIPEPTIWRARITSSTKRNFAAIVKTTPAVSAAATIARALADVDGERLLAQHVAAVLDACSTISGCVDGGRAHEDRVDVRRPRAAPGATGRRCPAPPRRARSRRAGRTSATAVIRAPAIASNTWT